VSLVAELGDISAAGTACRLRENHAEATTFAFTQDRKNGVFLGASPECLVHLQKGHVDTVALAGTRSAGDTAELLGSEKDKVEHSWVQKALRERLGELCVGVQESDTVDVAQAGPVQHLRTRFSAQARAQGDDGPIRFLKALHPTPAVAGWPLRAARHWLRADEALARGFYAGAVGWMAPGGDGHFVVAIRSGLLRDGVLHAFAGAGIVADSDPLDEWHETELKLQTLAQSVACHGDGADFS